MNALKRELWIQASRKIGEERTLDTQMGYVSRRLALGEKTVQRRCDDLAFSIDDWKRMYDVFGEVVLSAFVETIKNHQIKK